MTFPDSVRFLYSLGNELKTAKFGLERPRTLVEALGHPDRACRIVHVAGTNGKGSTCATIESGLRAAGFRTGLFTSPHLVLPTERIQVNGRPVSEEEFVWAFERVHRCAARLLDEGRIDAHPTYFETVTAMAFEVFRERGVEFAVLETGLGGRLDATNVVTPELCVITAVDFDHEAYLGSSLEAIAGEKAGILKPGVPAVFARQRPEAEAKLTAVADAVGAPVTRTSEWTVRDLVLHSLGCRFRADGPVSLNVDFPLAGEHQAENALAAVAALNGVGIPPEAIERGLRGVRWPGRLERVAVLPDVILDGAHNPSGARALARYIERFHADRHVWMIYGAMRDKAVEEIAGILFQLASRLILTAPDNPRAVRPEAVLEMLDHPCAQAVPRLSDALLLIQEAKPGDAVFITGSLFLVGEARALYVK